MLCLVERDSKQKALWNPCPTWRKLHLGVNVSPSFHRKATGEILTATVTTNDVSDSEVFCDLLDGVEGDIAQVSGDGAYDQRQCYQKARNIGTKATIPPRKDAVIWQHGNCKATPHPRNENLIRIRQVGRKKWKQGSGYHETTMFRLKVIFGGKLQRGFMSRSEKFDNQSVELFIQCAILNPMIQNG